jgi:predicted lactoylglutathione lyase
VKLVEKGKIPMGTKSIWFLPVNQLSKSREFFKAIGFKENPGDGNDQGVASFIIREQDFVLMLFPSDTSGGVNRSEAADMEKGKEVSINIDAQSREEIDRMAELVRKAGGKIFAEPGESQGWLYAFGFDDPDGHRWSMLYMDMSRYPLNKTACSVPPVSVFP